MRILSNQTKVFISVISDPESRTVVGASSTLKKASERFKNVGYSWASECPVIYEMPIDSPHVFCAFTPGRGAFSYYYNAKEKKWEAGALPLDSKARRAERDRVKKLTADMYCP